MTAPASSRPRTALMIAVFLTALSGLAFEVALSRAFSVLLRYHFVFLAISLATCGMGLGGLLDYLVTPWYRRTLTPALHLGLRAALLAVLYPLSIYLLFATPLAATLTSVWVVSGVCVLPFLVSGALLSRVFAEYAESGGTLYFADLLGASLGSFLVIAGLQALGATNVPFACGLMAALAAVAMIWPEHRLPVTVAAGALAVLLAGAMAINLHRPYVDLPIMPLADDAAAKPLYRELGDPSVGARILYSEWNAFARTDVVANKGPDGRYHDNDDLYIYTDGEVPTNMLAFGGGSLAPLAQRLRGFIGFAPFAWFSPRDVLLIGPGGGLDILLANAVGARRIDGVELNPSIPRIMQRFRDFNGGVYDQGNVRIHVDEGRSFVRRSADRYDLIYLALTKTATTAASSLALVEGYIYTTEAMGDYLDHLTPDGKIALVFQEPALLLRTMLSALDALERRGVPRAQALQSLAVCSVPDETRGVGPYRHLLLVSARPLARAESDRLARWTIGAGFAPGYFPGVYEPIPFSWLTTQKATTPEFVAAWNKWLFGKPMLNIAPRTDDQPFVVDLTFQVPGQYRGLLLGALLLALVSSGVAIGAHTRATGRAGARRLSWGVVYFSLLGAGFMVLEVCLAQKLVLYLGYPVLSLSVILFSLLLSSGAGSLFSQRFPVSRASVLVRNAALTAVCYGLALQLLHGALITATLGSDLRLRCLLTFLALAPLGFAMGIPFPTGVRALGVHARSFVPWMWGVNGLTSVVGSVGAMIMAKTWGFTVSLYVGLGVYLLVAALAWSGLAFGRSTPAEEADDH